MTTVTGGDDDVRRQKRDVKTATMIMTMTRDVRMMASGAPRHDGDDDDSRNATTGRR